MRIVFLSNFLNHHQVHLADEFYKVFGQDYLFIETMPIPQWLLDSGYPHIKRPYLLKAYENGKAETLALKLTYEVEVVIIGSAPECFVTRRIQDNKLTFRYSERWFKAKPWFLTGPRGWMYIFKNHISYRNKQLYMLCASAFTAKDVNAVGAYRNKCFKWGYFTRIDELDINALENKTKEAYDVVRMIWCARFIKLKHPELPVMLASRLKQSGYRFIIDMFGCGEELEKTKELAKCLGVEDCVNFRGNLPNDQILDEMRNHHIFLFTSDRNEGWGVVANEAMSCGCAVVGSDKIGSIPFLIEDSKNGLIFKSGNLNSLTNKVALLLDNPYMIESLSIEAYKSVSEIWSPQNAARSFLLLIEALNTKDYSKIPMVGPCSIA